MKRHESPDFRLPKRRPAWLDCAADRLKAELRTKLSGRPGFTLLECMVVIVLTGIIGLIGVQLVVQVMRLQGSEASRDDEQMQLVQIASQWRTDVHQCRRARLPDAAAPDSSIELEFLDQVIRYTTQKNDLVRQVVVEGTVRSKQVWKLSSTATFRLDQDRRLASLELQPSAEKGPRTKRPSTKVIVDAAVASNGEEDAKPDAAGGTL
jgi:prepilin-type N-terminal cleavage/methylation domain-containing protein